MEKNMREDGFWTRVWPPVIATLLAALVIAAFTLWSDVAGFRIVVERMQRDLQKISEDQTKWIEKIDERLRRIELERPAVRNGSYPGVIPYVGRR